MIINSVQTVAFDVIRRRIFRQRERERNETKQKKKTKKKRRRNFLGSSGGSHVVAGTRENARCSSSQYARYTFPADGPRRTAATFRFARFLFSSPSSLLPAGRALLRSHEESRCAHVPATARATATDTSSSSRFTLSPDPFAVRLSSCPLGRFVAPPLGLFLLFCRLFVVGVFFDGCLRAALFQTRKTAALSPFSRPRLIDDGYLREEPRPTYLSASPLLSTDLSRRPLSGPSPTFTSALSTD